MDTAECFDVGIADRPYDDFGNNIGAHSTRLSQAAREAKSRVDTGSPLCAGPRRVRWQPGAAACPAAHARIRSGNAGGPLIDSTGALVGVNYAGNDELDSNFAIHRDEVLEVISDLVDGEDVLSLGINGEALVGEDGAGLGIWVTP